jgi:signal transduction histidine kinase
MNSIVTGSTSEAWLDLLACCGHFAVAVAVARAAGPRALRWTLVALCLDMFGWNFAAFARQTTASTTWHLLDLVLSPLTTSLGLQAVVAFAGRLRALWRWVLLTHVASVALSLLAVLAFWSPNCARWIDSPAWAVAFLGILLAVTLGNLTVLVRHLRAHRDGQERTRGWLMLGAVAVGTALGSSELLKGFVAGLPGLGSLGSLAITTLSAIAVLHYRVFSHTGSQRAVASLAVLAALAIVLGAAVVDRLSVKLSVALVATSLGLPLAWALRELSQNLAAGVRRARNLAQMGRMLEQLAHDLRTPVASLNAAVQYVQAERERGLCATTLGTYLGLMEGQLGRIADTIDLYVRIARMVPSKVEVDVNTLVTSLARRNPERVEVCLAAELPRVRADPDLLSAALDNLVENALDALSPTPADTADGLARQSSVCRVGRRRGSSTPVVLRTDTRDSATGPVVEISVQDRGSGMDPRQIELAFDELFSTKPGGLGLGLSFARHVLEAHGGTVLLSSSVGRGTTAIARLPAQKA